MLKSPRRTNIISASQPPASLNRCAAQLVAYLVRVRVRLRVGARVRVVSYLVRVRLGLRVGAGVRAGVWVGDGVGVRARLRVQVSDGRLHGLLATGHFLELDLH